MDWEKNEWTQWEPQQREDIRKYQTEVTELKNTITELKNTLKGFNSRLDKTSRRISELKHRTVQLFPKQKKEKKKELKWRFLKGQHQADQHLHYRHPWKRREKGAENLVQEIMAENFLNLAKDRHPDPGNPENSK